uniref:Uncharacterized protein n=1 Tax=Arundo donax TaxID=35708 RepID=A0A0A8XTM2_ARUDO
MHVQYIKVVVFETTFQDKSNYAIFKSSIKIFKRVLAAKFKHLNASNPKRGRAISLPQTLPWAPG